MTDTLLPPEFISYTCELFGAERWQRFLQAFNQPPATSIRLNPWKIPPGVFGPGVPAVGCVSCGSNVPLNMRKQRVTEFLSLAMRRIFD